MPFLGKLFGNTDDGLPAEVPWERQPSILDSIRAHIVEAKPGLPEAGYALPDDQRIDGTSAIRWAAGAKEGVATHGMGLANDEEAAGKVVAHILQYAHQPTVKNKLAVYESLLGVDVLAVIDPVLTALGNEKNVNHLRVYELARSFVTESPDREPVKVGIALLGRFARNDDAPLFLDIGRHDEFTLYCAVAVGSFGEDSETALWTLARNAVGWGRIHAVERLAESTDPTIQRWLLRHGFRNEVMNEYLAGICARAGDLPAALSEPEVDRELLDAAGDIIAALIAGGPADTIDGYAEAQAVIASYLNHLHSSAETVQDFLHVNTIKEFLNEDDAKWGKRYGAGWTAATREALGAACESILNRPTWVDVVRGQLDSDDDVEFSQADQAATPLGIDTWNRNWSRLEQRPLDLGRWYPIVMRCDDDRIEAVLRFAENHLDLNAIATGAGDEMGVGPGFEPHRCLGAIVTELRRFPGRGSKLIEAALKSPVIGSRSAAVAALAEWPRSQWPMLLEIVMTQAAANEPRIDLRDRMLKAMG